MKKFFSILTALIILSLSVICVYAAPSDQANTGKTIFTIDKWVYTAIDGGSHLEIVDYIGEDSDIAIPRIVNDLMVVSIGDHCFLDDTVVKNVETSSPLWYVGEYAFLNSTSLESFECNFALKEIKTGAFSGTSSLKHIDLENSVVTVIRPQTFLNSGIEKIELPDTCTTLSAYSFGQCESLTRVTIPKSVTSIHEDAFKGSNNVVIYCYKDSCAHQFAVAKDIEYVLLDSLEPTEPETVPEQRKYLLGDADSDGFITVTDVTTIQRHLADISVVYIDEIAANVCGNGLKIVDVTVIQRSLAEMPILYPVGEWIYLDN